MNGEGKDWVVACARRWGKTVDFTTAELRLVEYLRLQKQDEELRALLSALSHAPYRTILERVGGTLMVLPKVPYVKIPPEMLADLKLSHLSRQIH